MRGELTVAFAYFQVILHEAEAVDAPLALVGASAVTSWHTHCKMVFESSTAQYLLSSHLTEAKPVSHEPRSLHVGPRKPTAHWHAPKDAKTI